MRSQIVISCLVVAAGLSSPLTARALTISAAGNDEVSSRVVHFADLNLQSRAGVRALYSRIKAAAQEVCEPVYFSRAESNISERRCQDRAIEQAVAAVRSDSLTAFRMALTDQTEHTLDR